MQNALRRFYSRKCKNMDKQTYFLFVGICKKESKEQLKVLVPDHQEIPTPQEQTEEEEEETNIPEKQTDDHREMPVPEEQSVNTIADVQEEILVLEECGL